MASKTKLGIKLEDLIDLDGPEGNAFAIMARVITVMRAAVHTENEIKQYAREPTSGDYEHLKAVSERYVNEV